MHHYKKIKDFNVGDSVKQVFLIDKIESRSTKTGQPYARMVLKDSSGEISANIWGFEPKNYSELKDGSFALMSIEVQEFKGSKSAASQSPPMLLDPPEDLSVYENTKGLSDDEIETHWSYLEEIMNTVKNPFIQDYLKTIKITYKNQIKNGAASATNRGAFKGGLVEHYAKVMRNALNCLDAQLKSKNKPQKIDKDIIIAGVFAHDLGKIFTYNVTPMKVETTRCGHLIQHLPLSYALSVQIWIAVENNLKRDVPEKLKDHINHIILSHHGSLSYGSPVVPQTVEAYIVHIADMMDSMTSNYCEDIIKNHANDDGMIEGSYFSNKRLFDMNL